MNNQKTVKAITKLIELTLKGQIEWNEIRPNILFNNITENGYIGLYKGEILKLYKPSPLSLENNSIFSTSGVMMPSSRAKLEVVDESGNTKFKFPPVSTIDELFRVASTGSIALNQFVNQILEED